MNETTRKFKERYPCDKCEQSCLKEAGDYVWNFSWKYPSGDIDYFEYCKSCYNKKEEWLEGEEYDD